MERPYIIQGIWWGDAQELESKGLGCGWRKKRHLACLSLGGEVNTTGRQKSGRRGRREKRDDAFSSAITWILFQPKIPLSFLSPSVLSDSCIHEITKLTMIVLSKNTQSAPQYAVNKLWKISKRPAPSLEEMQQGYKEIWLKFWLNTLWPTHPLRFVHFAVRQMPSLPRVCTEQEAACQAHVGEAKRTLQGHSQGTPTRGHD